MPLRINAPQDGVTLYNNDCLEVLKSLPDDSVDLVATDPPYFQVKKNAWDNQWADQEEFLAWMDSVLAEVWRVLKPNGSLYLFCSPRLSAQTELLIGERFRVLNQIVWRKTSGVHQRHCKEKLRAFFPGSERIVFAEHYQAEGFAKGNSGYARKCSQLKASVFAPLIEYFQQARARTGISAKAINAATGSQMCSHWFSASQWQLPSREQYQTLQQLFAEAGGLERDHQALTSEYEHLHRDYLALRTEYDDLRAQYERMRRPFAVSKEVPYTDVWDYAPVPYYPGKHPCEKPAQLMEHIILSSSRPGDLVADFFMGSGATGKAALKHGRRFLGVEFEEPCFETTCQAFGAG